MQAMCKLVLCMSKTDDARCQRKHYMCIQCGINSDVSQLSACHICGQNDNNASPHHYHCFICCYNQCFTCTDVTNLGNKLSH